MYPTNNGPPPQGPNPNQPPNQRFPPNQGNPGNQGPPPNMNRPPQGQFPPNNRPPGGPPPPNQSNQPPFQNPNQQPPPPNFNPQRGPPPQQQGGPMGQNLMRPGPPNPNNPPNPPNFNQPPPNQNRPPFNQPAGPNQGPPPNQGPATGSIGMNMNNIMSNSNNQPNQPNRPPFQQGGPPGPNNPNPGPNVGPGGLQNAQPGNMPNRGPIGQMHPNQMNMNPNAQQPNAMMNPNMVGGNNPNLLRPQFPNMNSGPNNLAGFGQNMPNGMNMGPSGMVMGGNMGPNNPQNPFMQNRPNTMGNFGPRFGNQGNMGMMMNPGPNGPRMNMPGGMMNPNTGPMGMNGPNGPNMMMMMVNNPGMAMAGNNPNQMNPALANMGMMKTPQQLQDQEQNEFISNAQVKYNQVLQQFKTKLFKLYTMFPPEFCLNQQNKSILFNNGQIPIALVCPTNLTFSLYAHNRLLQHGYTKVSSYATHSQLNDVTVRKKDKEKDSSSQESNNSLQFYKIYGCGVTVSPLASPFRDIILSNYHVIFGELVKTLQLLHKGTNEKQRLQALLRQQGMTNYQVATTGPKNSPAPVLEFNPKALLQTLQFCIATLPSNNRSIGPFNTIQNAPGVSMQDSVLQRGEVVDFEPLLDNSNIIISPPPQDLFLFKPAPQLFQTCFNFSQHHHQAFSSLLHQQDQYTNPTLPNSMISVGNSAHYTYPAMTSFVNKTYQSFLDSLPKAPKQQPSQNKPSSSKHHSSQSTQGNDSNLPQFPLTPTMGPLNEIAPPFELIFTYHPSVFNHVLDVLRIAESTTPIKRAIHVINIPTEDNPNNIPLAGELTLLIVNALQLTLDRSATDLPATPRVKKNSTTGEIQAVFEPVILDKGKYERIKADFDNFYPGMDMALHTPAQNGGDDFDVYTQLTFQQMINPFLKHKVGVAQSKNGKSADDYFVEMEEQVYSPLWTGQNVELILEVVESAIGEKLLHCIAWM